MNAVYVLDTSALIAMIEAEEGGLMVHNMLRDNNCIIPFVSLIELRYITLRERGQQEADMRYALLKNTSARTLLELDEATLLSAAQIKSQYTLSLGDCINVAVAIQNNAILVHKDPEFEPLKNKVRMEILPHKKKTAR